MRALRVGLLLALATPLAACRQSPAPVPAEGRIDVPGGRVYYRVEGRGEGTPLLVLHGGPGAPSYYLNPLGRLSGERPVVFYDQLGAGRSDRPSGDSLWRIPRFIEEIRRVRQALGLERIHLYGHSWGAILAIEYLLTDPPGVESVTLAGYAPSTEQWMQDARARLATLPDSVRRVIRAHEEAGTTDAPEYQAALMGLYHRYLSRTDPWPAIVDSTFAGFGQEEYLAMWGPSEFTATGRLRTWDARGRLDRIRIPALVTVGEYDEMRVESARDLADRLPDGRLAVIEGAAHLSMVDRPEAYARVIRGFLRSVDRTTGS